MGDDPQIIHQFIPYDVPRWIEDQHTHWQPDFVVWVESELWPNHLSFLKLKTFLQFWSMCACPIDPFNDGETQKKHFEIYSQPFGLF